MYLTFLFPPTPFPLPRYNNDAKVRPSLEILEVMLDAKGDPNVQDDNGKAVLHWLVEAANLPEREIRNRAELLLGKARANHKLKDKDGNTALDIATNKNYRSVVALLDEAELDWQASKVRENAQANGRAMVVGGVWGTGATVALLVPPIFEQWTMGGDPTAMVAAGTFVGSTYGGGLFFPPLEIKTTVSRQQCWLGLGAKQLAEQLSSLRMPSTTF